jgi:WhiB family transcriptional regulator, redox-sensing transcriptional regulator
MSFGLPAQRELAGPRRPRWTVLANPDQGRGGHAMSVAQPESAPVLATAEVAAALVDPAEAELSWQERALCAQTDPESFFPEKGGSTREAKRVCTGCEVRSECLEYALAHDERFGIWGGLSERERRRLKKAAV